MSKRTVNEKRLFYTTEGFNNSNIENLRGLEENVAYLLNKYPHLRGCDKCLIFHYFKHIDGVTKLDTEGIHRLTPAESITRARRHLQRDCNLFLPNPEVVAGREDKQDVMKEWNTLNKG